MGLRMRKEDKEEGRPMTNRTDLPSSCNHRFRIIKADAKGCHEKGFVSVRIRCDYCEEESDGRLKWPFDFKMFRVDGVIVND